VGIRRSLLFRCAIPLSFRFCKRAFKFGDGDLTALALRESLRVDSENFHSRLDFAFRMAAYECEIYPRCLCELPIAVMAPATAFVLEPDDILSDGDWLGPFDVFCGRDALDWIDDLDDMDSVTQDMARAFDSQSPSLLFGKFVHGDFAKDFTHMGRSVFPRPLNFMYCR